MNEPGAPPAAAARRRVRATWSAGAVVIAMVMIGMLPLIVRRVGDTDYWWHVVTARWIVDHRALPTHDLFTYTATANRWLDHEYLSQLLLYFFSKVGGQLAVSIAFGAVTWVGFFFLLARTTLRPTHFVATAGALAAGVVAGVAVWGPRPQMITFALVCVELYILERFLATGWRGLYAIPPMVAVWANLHGGVFIAFLFLGVAFVVEVLHWLIDRANLRARGNAVRIAAVSVASLIAGLLNPYGVSLYTYAWRTQTAYQQSFVREWQSPDFHSWEMRAFEVMVLLLLIGLALRRARPTLFSVAVALGGLALALQSWRHIAIFVAVATPLLAWTWSPALVELGRWWPRRGRRVHVAPRSLMRVVAGATVVVTVVVLVALRSLLGHQAASTADNYPVGAADYLAVHPDVGTRMFSDEGWGGYLIYRFYPEQTRRVWMYGELDVIGEDLLHQYADVVNLNSNWLDILTRWNVDYVVFEPGVPLTSALATLPSWHRVYADDVAVIYVRG